MSDRWSRTIDAVGPRLRQLRQRRDVTLVDLAVETGVSTSTLSRLEAGLRRPTLQQLLPLAQAHGVGLGEPVDAPPTGNPRVDLRPIVAGGGSVVIPLTRRTGAPRPTSSCCRPGATTPNRSRAPTRAATGPTSSTARCGWCSASTTSAARRGRPPSSTSGPGTGSAPPVPGPWSPSA